MKAAVKLGLLALVASLIMVGTVGAVSEWKFGDTVQLIVTTTNMGEVDVIRSTGTITVRDPRGVEYPCGDFDVEGVVHPGESVRVPINWDTGVALVNASWVPGYYDIILDGELAYANGEYEDTHSEVNEAFMLYLPSCGLRELPEIVYEGDVTGVTQLSDTYYPGSPFIIFVYVENTGTTLFIPEIQVSFTCEDGYTFEPEARCYYEDECEPGMNQYLYQCQLPDDMPEGTCEYDVDLEMKCIDIDITDENYPDGLAGFWHDNYVLSEVGSEPDEDWYQFTIDEEPAYISLETGPECIGYYDPGIYLFDEGYWPDDDLGYGYCFQWFYDSDEPMPDDLIQFCEESGYDDSMYSFYIDELTGETPAWQWTPSFGDEGYHDILVEVRERTSTDIEASDMIAVLVERKVSQDEQAPLYVWLTNECDYGFQPEFTIDIPEIEEVPTVTVYDGPSVAPIGTSVYTLYIDVSDIPTSDEGYYFTLSVEPVQIFNMELSEDFLEEVPDTEFYRFCLDDHEGCSFDEWKEIQDDVSDLWTWEVADDEWDSAGVHTIYVEVSDDLYSGDYTGEGTRIAVLDVTMTDSEGMYGDTLVTPPTEEGGEGSTNETGTTGGEEPEGETPPEEEPEEEPQGFSIQSIIDMILSFFRNLFG